MIIFLSLPVAYYKTKLFRFFYTQILLTFFLNEAKPNCPTHTLYPRLLLTSCVLDGKPDPALVARGQARYQTQLFRATSLQKWCNPAPTSHQMPYMTEALHRVQV